METDDAQQAKPHSHLFTLRLWAEPQGDGSAEWRFQLRHVLSGERRSFRDWTAVFNYLQEILQRLDQSDAP